MPTNAVDARLLKAHQKLMDKKFVPSTKGSPIDPEAFKNWFTCVVSGNIVDNNTLLCDLSDDGLELGSY
mgnify:CR=1 FL=1